VKIEKNVLGYKKYMSAKRRASRGPNGLQKKIRKMVHEKLITLATKIYRIQEKLRKQMEQTHSAAWGVKKGGGSKGVLADPKLVLRDTPPPKSAITERFREDRNGRSRVIGARQAAICF